LLSEKIKTELNTAVRVLFPKKGNCMLKKISLRPIKSGFISKYCGSICLALLVICLVLTACGADNTPPTQNIAPSSGAGVVNGLLTGVAASAAGSNSQAETPSISITGKASPTSQSAGVLSSPKAGTIAAAGSKEAIHVCSLFTKADAAITLGGPIKTVENAGDTVPEFGTATCTYSAAPPNSLAIVVSYSQLSKDDFDTGFVSYSAQAVPGLGDSAYYLANSVTALKGKVQVVVNLLKVGLDNAGILEQSKIVVQKVLDQFAKTGAAGDLTAVVPPGSAQAVTEADVPVYPGALKVNSRTAPGPLFLNTYTSPDSYDKIVAWYRQTFQAKSGYQSLVLEPEPGEAIGTVQKADGVTSAMLTVTISGPKKADRNPGTDANQQPIVLDPNSTLIEIVFSGKQ
jgi:hypothetical protein